MELDTIPDRIKRITNLTIKCPVNKLIYPNIFKKFIKKEYDTHEVINKMNFTREFDYKKSGSTGHTFKIKQGDTYYALKLSGYPKKSRYGGINSMSRPENAEMKMLNILSELVVSGLTPHIVLPVCCFHTDLSIYASCPSDANDKYKKFVKKFKEDSFYTNGLALISEWASSGDLLDFIRVNYKNMKIIHWKVILFQIIFTLAIIQNKYPSFRHNDLKANNILLSKHKNRDRKLLINYHFGDYIYQIPNTGLQVKLWDFDFASIKGMVDNDKVNDEWTDRLNIKNKQNQYYDLHFFFSTLKKKAFFKDFYSSWVPEEVHDFVDRIIPEKIRKKKYTTKKGRILVDNEFTTPGKLLREDKFFLEFRKKK